MKYFCPRCKSEKIVPDIVKKDVWICTNCGYSGKPVIIPKHIEDFWNKWRNLNS